jgi:hypothetical protein
VKYSGYIGVEEEIHGQIKSIIKQITNKSILKA